MPWEGSHPWVFTYLWLIKAFLDHSAWAHWLNPHHVARDSESYCSSSWWLCPVPNVSDPLSVDHTWNVHLEASWIASHLDPSRHSWTLHFNLDHSNGLQVLSILSPCFVSESDPLPLPPPFQEGELNSRELEGRDELWRIKPVKILESFYGTHESCGQGSSEKEKQMKRDWRYSFCLQRNHWYPLIFLAWEFRFFPV